MLLSNNADNFHLFDSFDMHYRIFGINFLIHFASLVVIILIHLFVFEHVSLLSSFTILSLYHFFMACSHRRHRQDKTVLSCSRRRCEQAIILSLQA